MADAGGLHRTKRADNYNLGDYNRVTFVNSSTTFHATGSHAGAGFIVAILGNMMTMPGLPKRPAAIDMDMDDDGNQTGIFG